MVYRIEFSIKAEKSFAKIDRNWQKKIVGYLQNKVVSQPLIFGKSLTGNKKGLWRYRVGDYRIICEIQNKELIVLVVDVAHRKDVYTK